MEKITPFLWYANEAEEAVNLYMSLFKNSKIISSSRYDKAAAEASGQREGSLMVIEFELDGSRFMAINAGPIFKFTEAVSFVIDCKDQEEVDHFWNGLTANGGEESMCGWLKDKYGLSWQVTPRQLTELLADKDRARAGRAMQAMLQMRKIDIKKLQDAADQK